jgi:hypothetical protein
MIRTLAFLFAALVATGCTEPLAQLDRPTRLTLSRDSAKLEVGDTARVVAQLFAYSGELAAATVSWRSSDPSTATVDGGLITAKTTGSATITAEAAGIRNEVRVSVVAARARITCSEAGTDHRSTAGGLWTRGDSPHFIRDTVRVTSTLVLEPGAAVCGYPGALLNVADTNRIVGIGTSTRSITFSAVDTVAGWKGIATDASVIGGSITFKHLDARYSGFISGRSLHVDSSVFYRTSFAAGGNFGGGSITNSVVDSGNVYLASGTFRNTVIRRGGLSVYYAKFGGTFTIDGGSIEDSPGTAFQFGSSSDSYDPALVVVKAPQIVRSRGAIAWMRIDAFFQLWPTREAQDALLNNVSRSITLSSDGALGSLYLRKEFSWAAGRYFSPELYIEKLTIEPGTNLRLNSFFKVGSLIAPGTIEEPITISAVPPPGCWGSSCGVTVLDSASSRVSNIQLVNAFMRFSTQ